jgi:hypothetical protein
MAVCAGQAYTLPQHTVQTDCQTAAHPADITKPCAGISTSVCQLQRVRQLTGVPSTVTHPRCSHLFIAAYQRRGCDAGCRSTANRHAKVACCSCLCIVAQQAQICGYSWHACIITITSVHSRIKICCCSHLFIAANQRHGCDAGCRSTANGHAEAAGCSCMCMVPQTAQGCEHSWHACIVTITSLHSTNTNVAAALTCSLLHTRGMAVKLVVTTQSQACKNNG